MEFQKTIPKRIPRSGASEDVDRKESQYWKAFNKTAIFLKHPLPVPSLCFAQKPPYRFSICVGARIQICSSKTGKVLKTISRFKDNVKSTALRADAKLVAGGDEKGNLMVFEGGSRAILRSSQIHSGPINSLAFSPSSSSSSSTLILSASSDCNLCLFDLPTSTRVGTFSNHADYVRSAVFLPSLSGLANPPNDESGMRSDILVSGSYDGTVRVWDTRIGSGGSTMVGGGPQGERGGEVACLSHGYPVECVGVHRGSTMMVSGGGPVVRVWDLLSLGSGSLGGRCLKAMSNHQKTVTCLGWDSRGTRLLSGGLDGLVKVYDVEEEWKIRHTMRYGGQIMSIGLSGDDSTLACSTSDGSLSIRRREVSTTDIIRRNATASMLESGGYERFLAGNAQNDALYTNDSSTTGGLGKEGVAWVTGPNSERKVRGEKRRRLKEWDKFLKAFRYSEALDSVMKQEVPPTTSFAVLSELIRRDGLYSALSERDDLSLEPVLSFLLRHLTDPRFCSVACDVANTLIDIYTSVLGQSPLVDDLFAKVRRKVEGEVKFQKELVKVRGALEMLFANSST